MLLPELSSEAAYVNQKQNFGFMTLDDQQYDLRFVQFQFEVNPGAFYHSLRRSHKACSIAKKELLSIKKDVKFDVIKSYFDVILAREMVKLRESSLAVLRRNLKDVERLYQTGSVPRFELLQARVRVKSTEPKLLEARNELRKALDMFNFHLGEDENRYTTRKYEEVLDRVREPAGREVRERLIDTAIRNRPEVLQLQLREEELNQARWGLRSSYIWPTFTVSGSYGMTYRDGTYGMNTVKEWDDNWQVRVAATYRWGTLIPIHRERNEERKQKLRMGETRERIDQIKRRTSILVRSSYGDLASSYETIQSQKQNVQTAEEGLRIARESYRNGVIKNADLLDAELSLREARSGFIQALYRYYVNRAKLERHTGTDIDNLVFREDTK
jgi:outer membrane protein TolC